MDGVGDSVWWRARCWWPGAALLMALLVLSLSGCGASKEAPRVADEPGTVTATVAVARAPTNTLAPADGTPAPATPLLLPAYTPDALWLAGQSYEGWHTFEHPTYRFRLRFPPGWSLTEVSGVTDTMAGHRVDLVDDADPGNLIHLAFRWGAEAVQILPTGMGQGTVVPRGSLQLLGEAVSREALVDRGEDVRVLYGGGGEIVRGDLVIWMDVYRQPEGEGGRGLDEDTQRLADAILLSLERVTP